MHNDPSINNTNTNPSATDTQSMFRSDDPFGDTSHDQQQHQSALRVREQRQRFLETSQRQRMTSRLSARPSNLNGTVSTLAATTTSTANTNSQHLGSTAQPIVATRNNNQDQQQNNNNNNNATNIFNESVNKLHQINNDDEDKNNDNNTNEESDDQFRFGNSFAGGQSYVGPGFSTSRTNMTMSNASSAVLPTGTTNQQQQQQKKQQQQKVIAPTLSSITSANDIISINVTGADRVNDTKDKKEVIYYNLCTTTHESAAHQEKQNRNLFDFDSHHHHSEIGEDEGDAENHHKPWTMMRRFSEFDALHAKFLKMLKSGTSLSLSLPETALTAFEANCELPSKLSFASFGKQSDDFISKRRKQLEKYLQSVHGFIKWLNGQLKNRSQFQNSLLLLLETFVAFLGGPKLLSTVVKMRAGSSSSQIPSRATSEGGPHRNNNNKFNNNNNNQMQNSRGLIRGNGGGDHDFVVVGGGNGNNRMKHQESDDGFDDVTVGISNNNNRSPGAVKPHHHQHSGSLSSPKVAFARNGSLESFGGTSYISHVNNNNFNSSSSGTNRISCSAFIPPYQLWHNPQQHFFCIIGFTSCMIQVFTKIDAKSFDGRDVIVYGQSTLTHSRSADEKLLKFKNTNKKNNSNNKNKNENNQDDQNNNDDDDDDFTNSKRPKCENELTPRSSQARDILRDALVDLVDDQDEQENRYEKLINTVQQQQQQASSSTTSGEQTIRENEAEEIARRAAELVTENGNNIIINNNFPTSRTTARSTGRITRRDSAVAVPMKTEITKSSFFVPTQTLVTDHTENYMFNGLELKTATTNNNNNKSTSLDRDTSNEEQSSSSALTGGATSDGQENTNDILFSFVVEVPPPFEPSYCFIKTSPGGATIIEWPRPKFL